MPTVPRHKPGLDLDARASTGGMPIETVNALLAEGKLQEAGDELERLLFEGVDSGPGIEATPQFWADLKAEIRATPKR